MQVNTSLENPKSLFPTRIAFVWSMVFLGMIIYALVWFMLGSVTMTIIEAMESAFTFSGNWDYVVDLIKNIILWHPIISIFGWILWGFLNSMRRDVRYDIG